jgi:hypothetical protein
MMHVSARWIFTGLVAIGSFILLAALRAHADVAVGTTQPTPTAAEQIEKIAEIQKSQESPVATHGADVSHVEAHGLVTTADGSPLPEKLTLSISSHSSSVSHEWFTGYSFGVDARGHFGDEVESGEITFAVDGDGYAPAFAGPVAPDKNGKLPEVKIVLDPGFTARVRVVDQNSKPVPGATITTAYVAHFIIRTQKLTTDSKGMISLSHATVSAPMQLETSTPGFEFERKKVTLSETAITEFKLTPSKPATGTVLDQSTELPLAGATIAMVERKGFETETHPPASDWDKPPVLARTADDGTFSLQTLRADCEYAMWVSAPGHGSELFLNVRAGQEGLIWKLGTPRIIHGKIIGDLSRLDRMPGKAGISRPIERYDYFFPFGSQNFQGQSQVDVTIADGVGTFELRDPPPGHVVFHGPPAQNLKVDMDQIPPLVVIEMNNVRTTQPSAVATRQVVFKFDLPGDAPQPRGKLRVFHFDPVTRMNMPDLVPLENGEAKFKIGVPGKVGYNGDQLIGYWAAERMEIDVPAGTDPLEIRIPVVPAGAVSGIVLGPDGKPFNGGYFFVCADAITKSPAIGDQPYNPQPYNRSGADGKFFMSPLPLGGKYQFTAMADMRLAVSEVLSIDAQTLIRDLTLKFAEGKPVKIRVVDADGQPRSGAAVTMSFRMPQHGFSAMPKTTDRDGIVTFEHVDPDAPGKYSFDIAPGINYAGSHQEVQIDGKPVNITLAQGYQLKGQVFNSLDGTPMSKHKITARPDMAGGTVGRQPTETRTDAFGYFTFENLDQHEYQLEVEGCAPREVTIEKKPDGSIQFHYPDGWKAQIVRGGQPEPVVVQVQPWER